MQPQKETTKKTTQTKAVATKQTNLPSENTADLNSSWGAEEATTQDVIIPKLLLMHGLSKEVQAGNKQQGDLIRSTTLETLAKKGEKLKVIPFMMTKTWRVSDISENPPKYRREEVWNASNDDLPWEFEEVDPKDNKTKKMRRDKAFNFMAMVVKDIDSGHAFPIKIQFLRTSSQAGRALADHFAKSRMFGTPPARQTWEITSEHVPGSKPYHKFNANPSTATTPEHMAEAKRWFDLIKGNPSAIREDDSEDSESVDVGSNSAAKEEF